jgi:UDP-3-O-[3-hydroxymyristoyl] N-acetylglucosamine deacetylase
MRYRLIENQMQKTLKCDVSASGVGLFTGEQVSIRLKTALANTGICFQRMDLPDQPRIEAQIQYVSDTLRCTRLKKDHASLSTVEHLLSALSAFGIDNALIEVHGPEIPIFDGSARAFVQMIEDAGIFQLNTPRRFFTIAQPVFWSEGETHLVALPASEMRISYTLHYPLSPLLRSQYLSLPIDAESYKNEISLCRTFSFYEEIAPFIEKGLIKGGCLENAVVIQGDKVINPGGARFRDEMVRHKILDLIGDLSLLGGNIQAHIIAIRSGHSSNVAFAKTLQNFLVPECQELKMKTRVCRESNVRIK